MKLRGRRLIARLDRRAAILLYWVPSWGTSLLLHAAFLLLLGLYVYAHSSWGGRDAEIRAEFPPAAQLRDNAISLSRSDHAGDPFTHEKKADAPSIPIERADPEVTLVAQPEIPRLTDFTPVVAGPEPTLLAINATGSKARGTGKGGTIAPQTHSEDITAPFSGRSTEMKGILLRREGGTAESEKAVDEGLDWLARHQKLDGGWSLNFQSECKGQGCLPHAALDSDTAATGLALLPLLGAGHIHTVKTRYQANIRRGLDWLIEHQNGGGDLFVGGVRNAHLYSHAIAAMALCEAYGLSQDERLREPATRAIRFIIDAQNTQTGGWRYEPGDTGDTSVFGWQMFALRSARLGGIDVPRNVLKGCKAYLDEAATDSSRVTYSYQPGRKGTYVMTAEALLARQYLGWPRDFPPLVKGVGHVAENLKESTERNIYYWYYATQLLHNMHNKEWPRWNVKIRESLIRTQVAGQGCDRGSWDPFLPQLDTWGGSAGRLYETALTLLTLEVYYRYLPLYRRSENDPPEKEAIGAGKDEVAAKRGFEPVPSAK
ncbi:MAG: terpene cyclase/mutase family protein [Isosphaeraceae bacterium]|nr:terpene cyclase/mutase family protein [Isosphaeraceae bacterium]